MFDIFKILPKAFSTWKAIQACLDGGATAAELSAAVGEFRGLLSAIPQLRGILAIFDVVIGFVEKVAPNLLDDADKMQELNIDPDAVQSALNVTTLYGAIMADAKASGEFENELVKLDDVGDMI